MNKENKIHKPWCKHWTLCYKNPPFYTIKFEREIFCDPIKHIAYTGLKEDVGKYKKGTPLPSHEYVGDCLQYGKFEDRAFMVGCHGENVSTFYNHPFKGEDVGSEVFKEFGLADTPVLKLKFSLRKWIMRKLPHAVRRKLRFWNEKLYNWVRS